MVMSVLPRRDLNPRSLLAELDPALRAARLRELGEGFDNVAYAVDERLVLRISKIADPQRRARTALRDIRLAGFAQHHSTLRTSRIVAADPAQGVLLGTLVAGVGADRRPPDNIDEFAEAMAGFLVGLWAAPASTVVDRPEITAAQWLADTARLYEAAAPLLPVADRRAIERFLAEPVRADDARNVFSHNDLGDEHLIVDDGGRLVGVIDWSDAVLGDPARDLALVLLDLGPAAAARIVRRIGTGSGVDPDLAERARWWGLRAGVEGVAWRTLNDRPFEVTLGRLRRVLAT